MRSLFGGNSSTASTVDMALDDLCDLLGNERRRLIIQWFDDGRRVSKQDLATQIATLEYSTEPGHREQKAVYVSLHQTHLPRLRKHGVVVGDRYIEAGPNHEAVLDALRELRGRVEVSR